MSKIDTLATNNGDSPPLQHSTGIASRPTDWLDDFDRVTPSTVYARSSAFQDEFDQARRSNLVRDNQESRAAVERKYSSIAHETDQGEFDPVAIRHDAEYDFEFKRQRLLRQEAEDAFNLSEGYVRDKEDKLSQMETREEVKNGTPWGLLAIATITLAIGVVPTIYDAFLTGLAVNDPLAAWFAAAVVSIPIAALLAGVILVETGRQITTFNYLGLIAGFFVAFGLFLVRYSVIGQVDSLNLGLLCYEVAVIVGLEAVMYLRRKEAKAQTETNLAYVKAEADLHATRDQRDRSRQAYDQADKAIKDHIVFIEDRRKGTLFNAAIEEALVASAAAGRDAARAANYARKIGKKETDR